MQSKVQTFRNGQALISWRLSRHLAESEPLESSEAFTENAQRFASGSSHFVTKNRCANVAVTRSLTTVQWTGNCTALFYLQWRQAFHLRKFTIQNLNSQRPWKKPEVHSNENKILVRYRSQFARSWKAKEATALLPLPLSGLVCLWLFRHSRSERHFWNKLNTVFAHVF